MYKQALVWVVLLAVLLALGAGVASATSSLTGPTGIVSVPTAAVASAGSLEAALSYQRMTEKLLVVSTGLYTPPPPPYGPPPPAEPFTTVSEVKEHLNVYTLEALGGIAGKGEYWADYAAVRDNHNSSIWGAGGKLQLAKEPEKPVSAAIGIGYWKWVDALGIYDASVHGGIGYWNAYLVATRDFTRKAATQAPRVLGSLGLMYLKASPDHGSSESLTRPFLGVEVSDQKGTTLGLEYRWKDIHLDRKAVTSAVVRHIFSSVVAAEVGVTNSDPFGIGLDDHNIFVRVSYYFNYGGHHAGGTPQGAPTY